MNRRRFGTGKGGRVRSLYRGGAAGTVSSRKSGREKPNCGVRAGVFGAAIALTIPSNFVYHSGSLSQK